LRKEILPEDISFLSACILFHPLVPEGKSIIRDSLLDKYVQIMYHIHIMRRVTITMPQQQIERVKEYCSITGLTISELHRRAIDYYIKMHPADLTNEQSLRKALREFNEGKN